jgi:putative ABC transport system permease protein
MRFRYAIRSLVRDPAFIFVAIVVLSLGIAANTSAFAVIDQVILDPLPYRDISRLVMVWESNPLLGEPAGSRVPAAWTNLAQWQLQSHSFERIEAFEQVNFNLTGLKVPEHVTGAHATSGYFQMLGVEPSHGRTFTAKDAQPGADPVVVVTEAFSRAHYASDDPIGKKLLLNGIPYVIVGVLPKNFHLPLFFQGSFEIKPVVFTPLPLPTANDASTKTRQLFVSARLKSNVAITQARLEMTAIANQLAKVDPQLNAGYGINIIPLTVENADPDLASALYLLWLSAFVVLLLGCANLAGLTTVRSMNRQRDLAIMKSLGASPVELVSIVLIETSLLAFVSALLAILFSYAGIGAVRALQPSDLLGADRLSIDARSLWFAGLSFLFCILMFGILPSWFATRPLLGGGPLSISRSKSTRSGEIARRMLVCAEVAIALFVAISATLLVRSFRQILKVDPGFRPQHVFTAKLAIGPPQYSEAGARRRFCDALLLQIRQIPTVHSASLVDNLPLDSIRYTYFEIEGRPASEPSKLPSADYANVSSGFFETLGTPLLRGRLFTDEDMQEHAEKVVILNQSLANKLWPNQDPIASHIRYVTPSGKAGPWRRVVGIVRDFHQYNIETPPRPEMFWPSDEYSGMTLVVKSTADSYTISQRVQEAVSHIDKEEPVSEPQTLQGLVDQSIAQRRFNAYLLSGFAVLSVILALVGIYGLISYIVSSRSREIAIRLALGARPGHVLRLLLLTILPFAVVGIVLGMALSVSLTKVTASLLFGISALDPVTFILLPAAMSLVIVLACLHPAKRALRIDPNHVLRQE